MAQGRRLSDAERAGRVCGRLETLFAIGGGAGANRPGLSAHEERACELIAGWMRDDGLAVEVDPVGNVIGRRRGSDPAAAEIWIGSHVDSVPDGGRFDGALGVLAGLEAMVSLADAPSGGLALWIFRDEEGWRFGRSCFGSRAVCGALEPGELETADADGVTIAEAIARLRPDAEPSAAAWTGPWPGCFLELHVEQGPVLERERVALGVVTAIVGMSEGRVRFSGRSGHAGTTPMSARADALRAACNYVERLSAEAESLDGAVVTVGRLAIQPGAQNVIAGVAELSIDLRAADARALETLRRAADQTAHALAAAHGCRAELAWRWRSQPAQMAPAVRAALRVAVARTGVRVLELPSGAGHDAAVMASAGIPSGMLFVRSLAGGASHTPEEASSEADVAVAIAALRNSLPTLAATH